MTEQTFHITAPLDRRSTLCGRTGRVWAAPAPWPSADEMRSGRFVRCKECDRSLTPALQVAIDRGRQLRNAALQAWKTDWNEGCKEHATATDAERAEAEALLRKCHELGRRAGVEAATLVREVGSADCNPGSDNQP